MVQSGKILITGAAGFVGVALCRNLHRQGYALRALVRRGGSQLPEDLLNDLTDVVEVDDLCDAFTDDFFGSDLMAGVDRVVHLAARAHTGGRSALADLFFGDNLDATVALARKALAVKVKKFIFISTIKVNGEGVLRADHLPYKVADLPRPEGAYAVSKWRAEQELTSLFSHSEVSELVVLRPPLIYGVQAKGNYAFLQKWLSWGLPLPIPRAGNRRSLLALDRLVKIIEDILAKTAIASEKLLLPCDQEEWSTERLAHDLAQKVGRRARTLAIPAPLLSWLATLFNREDFCIKLFGSLRVDCLGEVGGEKYNG